MLGFSPAKTTRVAGLLLLCALLTDGQDSAQPNFDVLDFIDPFIGTENGGMVKAVADTQGENQGGFAYDTTHVTGFSHTHDSGTGGAASMGNFPIFVHPRCPDNNLTSCKWRSSDRAVAWKRDSPRAQPGYFSISLENGVHAEMTVTNHSALYQFSFPDATGESLNPVVLVDITDLPESRNNGMATADPDTGRLTGSGNFNPSFGLGTYNIYFCADFRGASVRDTGSWTNATPTTGKNNVSVVADWGHPASSFSAGTFVRFDSPGPDGLLTARVGVSFISVEQACLNAEKEQPEFDFDGTVAAAESAWRGKMEVISVNADDVSTDLQTVFWSGAYRAMISPQDYTGENPLWESNEPYYDSFYCIWDSFRGIHQLLTLIDPISQSRMMRGLVDIYRHEGYLPDCRMSLCKGWTQGGSNADVLIVEAYLKGVIDVDWDTAYEAIVKDAEIEPQNWNVEGRGGLASWKTLGYIPKNDIDPGTEGLRTRSVSRTVEYAYNDFCIALMADQLGHASDRDKYLERSRNWRNVYKEDQTSSISGVDTNFTGFLQPRHANGSWAYQDPIFCSPLMEFTSCYLNANGHETYEGSTWLYTFFVPQDMAALITTLGGAEAFVSRLSFLHDSGILYLGDEQAFLTVFQFHYAGRPALSAKRAHSYIPSQFNTTVGGIPGNDDSGAMGSFAVLSMIGLFPVHGQDVYLITAPFFKEVSIRNEVTGNVATIRNINFDPTYESIFIQSARRDGAVWTKNWIGHDFFADGGILELELGSTESDWGTRVGDLPPSFSAYEGDSVIGQKLRSQGAHLAILYAPFEASRRDELLAAGYPNTTTNGPEIRTYECDITSPDSVNSAFASLHKEMVVPSSSSNNSGSERNGNGAFPSILINTAGYVSLSSLELTPPEETMKHLSTNVHGPMLTSQAFANMYFAAAAAAASSSSLETNQRLQPPPGRIINLASKAAHVALHRHGAYCASKSALLGLTRCMASEWGPRGITANSVSPTVAWTELGQKAWGVEPGVKEELFSKIPVGRAAMPAEVADAVMFLCADSSGMVNGADVRVDGGYTIR
ncbi:glycosyl hydrolase family 92-domain-containing protein [Aspergillus cavernicola]|uniref:Glycosyl hydrolase family 92-domain-containing protein n=1 Tax=Aspergillus cavernicola TaxID=176166 RepID=A0ABR4HRG7_9EURO